MDLYVSQDLLGLQTSGSAREGRFLGPELVEQEPESRLQIAWINTSEEEQGDTVDIVVYDPFEHRIAVFESDTGLPANTNQRIIIERAKEQLQIDGGYIVHAVEPWVFGYAAIVEQSPG